MKKIITIILLFYSVTSFAQTGIGTTTPNASAQLDVSSTNKGFLPPRVALTGTANAAPLAAHVAGMVVFNTATVSNVTPGLYVNNGSVWEKQAGGTATTLTGLTSTVDELNTLDGFTGTVTDLNYAKDLSATGVTNTEFTYLDGITSNVQTQLNGKQSTITGGATTIASSNLTVNRALISDASGKVAVSPVTSTELGYVDGVSSNIQTQLNNKVIVTKTAIITDTAGDNYISSLFGIYDFRLVLGSNTLVYIARNTGSASLSATVNSSGVILNYQNISTNWTPFSGTLDTNNGDTNNFMDIFISNVSTNGTNYFYHFTLSTFNNSESVFCELTTYN